MDAAALVDTPVLIPNSPALVEDIKSGLPVDPLSSRGLALCLKGSPSPGFSLFAADEQPRIRPRVSTRARKLPQSRPPGEAWTTQQQVTSVTT